MQYLKQIRAVKLFHSFFFSSATLIDVLLYFGVVNFHLSNFASGTESGSYKNRFFYFHMHQRESFRMVVCLELNNIKTEFRNLNVEFSDPLSEVTCNFGSKLRMLPKGLERRLPQSFFIFVDIRK